MADIVGTNGPNRADAEEGYYSGFNAAANGFTDSEWDIIRARGGDDTVVAGPGSDTIYGGDGNDTLDGGRNQPHTGRSDTLYGDDGDDILTMAFSSYGNLYGGAGNDHLTTPSFSGVVEGGAGADTIVAIHDDFGAPISYRSSPAGVRVDLRRQEVSGGHANGDIISGVQHVIGSDHDDVMFGTNQRNSLDALNGNNTLYGGGGADGLSGGSGRDTLYGGKGDDYLSPGSGADQLFGGPGNDTVGYGTATQGVTVRLGSANLHSIENVRGSDHADLIVGLARDETLSGGEGSDRIYGKGGDDVLSTYDGDSSLFGGSGNDLLFSGDGADLIDGGAGEDSVGFTFASGTFVLNLVDPGQSTGTAAGDRFVSIELFTLSSGSDRLVGDGRGNTVDGRFGNDTLEGNGGRDDLDGGYGDDTVNGGAGSDSLFGGFGADTIIGGRGNDYVEGGEGADSLDGGGGKDTLAYGFLSDPVTIDLARGRASGDSEVDGDRFRNFENLFIDYSNDDNTLIGSGGRNTITGSYGNDIIRGGNGDDRLISGGGADTLTGGGGRDTFVLDGPDSVGLQVITDFRETERIGLDASEFEEIGNRLTEAELRIGAEATTSDHRVLYDPRTGLLSFDPDGRGGSDARAFAEIGRGVDLTVDHFLIV